ncbi:MAG: TATA-binding protein-associated factor mot1 [Chaenotheca gracillima]|nr:MAG: TATA-binding protein-associated factor mot1 [Chaenotheca gracillima]
MSPARRRSSRLKGGSNGSPAKTPNRMAALSSLVERDESPGFGATASLDAIMSSPIARHQSSFAQTPATMGRFYPSLDEMHPSKAQQSTVKQPDSGLRFGFHDPAPMTAPPRTGHNSVVTQDTPTKATGFLSKLPSSPGFTFRARNADAELSPEAKKLMSEVRDVASSLKAKLMSEREDEKPQTGSGQNDLFGAGGRRLATPKGKAGRFSDVHMSEFKKMDSIAGHPSAFRAQPGRIEPASKSLKRTKSQAKLDDGEGAPLGPSSPRPVEKQSPTKRPKQTQQDDASSARPISREGTQIPSLARSKSGNMASITTPTKASLARSASVKAPKTSHVPIPRTPSTRRIFTGARTEANKKYQSSMAKLGNLKSILRRPQAGVSEAIAPLATTPSATPIKSQANRDKELPSLPGTPKDGTSIYRFPSMKHVTFTPNGTGKVAAQASPSPTKAVEAPPPPPPKNEAREVTYPSLPGTPAASPSKARRPSGPGDFTFRAEKSIKFGPPALNGSTIRQVRPSIGPGSAAPVPNAHPLPAVPHGIPNKKRHREDTELDEEPLFPSVPHGMSNKKRHREGTDSDEEMEDQENQEPAAKKHRGLSSQPSSPIKSPVKSRLSTSPAKRGRKGVGAGGKSPGILSLSRLNALARPKGR